MVTNRSTPAGCLDVFVKHLEGKSGAEVENDPVEVHVMPPSGSGRYIRASTVNVGESGIFHSIQIVGFSAKVCSRTSASTEYGGLPASNLR